METQMQWLWLLLVAAVVGFIALAVVQGMRQSARRAAVEARERPDRERRARDLGWRYDWKPDGDVRYRIEGSGPDGLRWTMKFDTNAGSSSAVPQLVWTGPGMQARRLEMMLGPRARLESLTGGAARRIIGASNFLLGGVVGAPLQDMHDFVGSAKVVLDGRAAGGFAIVMRDAALARRLLQDAELSRLLHSWPPGMSKDFSPAQAVSAQLDRDGLRVTVNVDGPPMAVCEHLALLGEALAARLREGRFVSP